MDKQQLSGQPSVRQVLAISARCFGEDDDRECHLGRYLPIYRNWLDSRLQRPLVTLAYITRQTRFYGKEFYESQSTIADALQLRREVVNRHVDKLQSKGFLIRRHRKRRGSKYIELQKRAFGCARWMCLPDEALPHISTWAEMIVLAAIVSEMMKHTKQIDDGCRPDLLRPLAKARLSKETQVDRKTVRRALDQLMRKNMVTTREAEYDGEVDEIHLVNPSLWGKRHTFIPTDQTSESMGKNVTANGEKRHSRWGKTSQQMRHNVTQETPVEKIQMKDSERVNRSHDDRSQHVLSETANHEPEPPHVQRDMLKELTSDALKNGPRPNESLWKVAKDQGIHSDCYKRHIDEFTEKRKNQYRAAKPEIHTLSIGTSVAPATPFAAYATPRW